jgi:hypothetical protein
MEATLERRESTRERTNNLSIFVPLSYLLSFFLVVYSHYIDIPERERGNGMVTL